MDETAALGPLVRTPAAGDADTNEVQARGCWQCACLRLAANPDAEAVAALLRGTLLREGEHDGPHASPASYGSHRSYGSYGPIAPAAHMLGTALAFEAFRWLTGVLDPETDGAIVTQHLDTLATDRRRCWPTPCAERAEGQR